MSGGWTKGPWRVDEDRDGFAIVGKPEWKCRRFGIVGEWDVAKVDDMLFDHPNEYRANAHLIAAAPELAEALNGIISSWEDGLDGDSAISSYVGTSRAALRKAKGEPA